jgi:hypothetical protein
VFVHLVLTPFPILLHLIFSSLHSLIILHLVGLVLHLLIVILSPPIYSLPVLSPCLCKTPVNPRLLQVERQLVEVEVLLNLCINLLCLLEHGVVFDFDLCLQEVFFANAPALLIQTLSVQQHELEDGLEVEEVDPLAHFP